MDSLTLSELMNFTTYFNADSSQRYQSGFTLRSLRGDTASSSLEKWKTDFHNNTFEKETMMNDRDARSGAREGRNEVGELWHEKWHLDKDGKQGWLRWTQAEAEGN